MRKMTTYGLFIGLALTIPLQSPALFSQEGRSTMPTPAPPGRQIDAPRVKPLPSPLPGEIDKGEKAKPEKKPAPVVTKPKPKPLSVEPTIKNLSYGTHDRNVLDFYKAESTKPTPVLFFIHGGGWMNGDKASVHDMVNVKDLLSNGISVASINYRYISQAGDVYPPVKVPLHDAARALQFVRSKAGEWNIDKTKIAAAGSSAGACSSLWLLYHDDLADPKSEDLVSRESTRLFTVAVNGAQTTLDPQQMKDWTPNSTYGGHSFGEKNFKAYLENRAKHEPLFKEYSPYHLVSSDDPSAALFYRAVPAIGKDEKDPTHSANFGVKLQERCREFKVKCDLVYPGSEKIGFNNVQEYLIQTLKSN